MHVCVCMSRWLCVCICKHTLRKFGIPRANAWADARVEVYSGQTWFIRMLFLFCTSTVRVWRTRLAGVTVSKMMIIIIIIRDGTLCFKCNKPNCACLPDDYDNDDDDKNTGQSVNHTGAHLILLNQALTP